MSIADSNLRKLDDIGVIARGKSKHRPRNDPILYGGKYPFIQTGDVKHANFYITSYSQTYSEKGLAQSKLWQPGTLCITIAANIADTAILKIPACFPDSIIGFIPHKNKADIRFVKYCLETYKLQIQSISRGTTQDNLSLEKLRSINFRVPILPVQEKIAAVLSAYDDLIENNNRRIAILEKMAEEIYREWFVRMRFPGHEKVTFHKGIPEGWEVIKLPKICSKVTDGTHDTPQPTAEGYYLVTGKHLKNNFIDFSEAYYISSDDHYEISKRSKVDKGDIILSNIGSIGIISIVDQDFEFSVKNAIIIKPINYKYTIYLYCIFDNNATQELFKLEALGTSQKFLSLSYLRNFKLLLPSKPLINRFSEILYPVFKRREKLYKSNLNLKQTRDLLLGRLISGKLSVENLHIQFPPSMEEHHA